MKEILCPGRSCHHSSGGSLRGSSASHCIIFTYCQPPHWAGKCVVVQGHKKKTGQQSLAGSFSSVRRAPSRRLVALCVPPPAAFRQLRGDALGLLGSQRGRLVEHLVVIEDVPHAAVDSAGHL